MADFFPFLAFLFYLAIMLFLVLRNVRILSPNERLVVFRMGAYYRAFGPGFVFLFPIIDRGRIINLDGVLPGWRGISREESEEAIKKYINEQPDFLERNRRN